jgi:hypothetical protein
MLGEDGLRILTQLINNIYEPVKWPKDFTAVITTALKKKPRTAKRREHHRASLIANTAKVLARILRRRLEMKTEDVLIKDQLGFRREKCE